MRRAHIGATGLQMQSFCRCGQPCPCLYATIYSSELTDSAEAQEALKKNMELTKNDYGSLCTEMHENYCGRSGTTPSLPHF